VHFYITFNCLDSIKTRDTTSGILKPTAMVERKYERALLSVSFLLHLFVQVIALRFLSDIKTQGDYKSKVEAHQRVQLFQQLIYNQRLLRDKKYFHIFSTHQQEHISLKPCGRRSTRMIGAHKYHPSSYSWIVPPAFCTFLANGRCTPAPSPPRSSIPSNPQSSSDPRDAR